MKDAEGSMPIWEAIYKNSIFYDECFHNASGGTRIPNLGTRQHGIKIRFPIVTQMA